MTIACLPCFRRGPSGRPVTFSLLASLYLVVALTVPGAFHIAEQASLLSSSQLVQSAEHSSAQFSSGSDENGVPDSWSGPKRLRGALLTEVSIGKIVNLIIASLAVPKLVVEDMDSDRKPLFADDPEPGKAYLLPPQLLQRPPPA